MSIKIYFEPAEIFFDNIEAKSCGSTSRLSNLSTLIILSSEGANPKDPPQAKHAPSFLITFLEPNYLIGSIQGEFVYWMIISLLLKRSIKKNLKQPKNNKKLR